MFLPGCDGKVSIQLASFAVVLDEKNGYKTQPWIEYPIINKKGNNAIRFLQNGDRHNP
jgi:hypothetical protein